MNQHKQDNALKMNVHIGVIGKNGQFVVRHVEVVPEQGDECATEGLLEKKVVLVLLLIQVIAIAKIAQGGDNGPILNSVQLYVMEEFRYVIHPIKYRNFCFNFIWIYR